MPGQAAGRSGGSLCARGESLESRGHRPRPVHDPTETVEGPPLADPSKADDPEGVQHVLSSTLVLALVFAGPGQLSGGDIPTDPAQVKGVVVDTRAGAMAFPARVQDTTGKPCVDAWGQRFQAFIGASKADGEATEFASFFVFLTDQDINDVYRGLAELGLESEKNLSRAEGKAQAGKVSLEGDPVAVDLVWKVGETVVERPYESFVKEKVIVDGKEVIRPWTPKWAFHGSGVIHKEKTGCVACPCDCPGGLIADVRNPVYEPKPTVFFDTTLAPPPGTKVVVKIRALPREEAPRNP